MRGGESAGMWSGAGRTRLIVREEGGLNGEVGGRGLRRMKGFKGHCFGMGCNALDCQMENERE